MSSPLPRVPGGSESIGAPWFVQFWPVFIAVLMGLSIVGSLATVAIAYRHADVDVRQAERVREEEGGSGGAAVGAVERGRDGSDR